ncbi:unnamed protein product [Parajaminaea phylloscopi]
MKAVLQRVTGACVHVDGKLVSTIGPGLVALIGISTEDSMEDIVPLANKVAGLKFWNQGQKAWAVPSPPQYPPSEHRAVAPSLPTHSEGAAPTTPPGNNGAETPADSEEVSRKEQVWGGQPWKSSVVEFEGEILCISQFTLHARTVKGTKPDFHRAMNGTEAKGIYDAFLKRLGEVYRPERIRDGAFGEMMSVSLTNDGPVTLIVDTKEKRG